MMRWLARIGLGSVLLAAWVMGVVFTLSWSPGQWAEFLVVSTALSINGMIIDALLPWFRLWVKAITNKCMNYVASMSNCTTEKSSSMATEVEGPNNP